MAEEYSQDYTGNGEEQYQESMEVQAMGEGDGPGEQSPGDRINASKNDDDERKIFVGGLSWETTVKDLREYFEKFGGVLDCTLKTDPATNRSRGFGFVLFAESVAVDKVLAEKTHLLHGRNIDPKRAKARGGREPVLKVFVGGLDPNIPEPDIRSHFEKFGKVTEVDLPYDKSKNQRRAFCFVSFESEEVVDRVCTEPKQEISEGKRVDVKKATPKNEQYGGGGYGSYGGYGGGYGNASGGGGGGGGGRGRGGFRGRGRGGSGGNYNQGNGWGNYDYNSYYGNNQGGYDYNNYYNQGYGNYDYNNYYGGQGWGNYNYNQGYGSYGNGYDYSGWGYGSDNQGGGNQSGNGYGGGGKTKRGGTSGSQQVATSSNSTHGYHPYTR